MLCDDLEGWDGREREAQEGGEIYIRVYIYNRFTLLYSRYLYSIVKQLLSNKNKFYIS